MEVTESATIARHHPWCCRSGGLVMRVRELFSMHHIGTLKTTGNPIPLGLNQRFQGVYGIGQTGTGKSTFLKHGFLQDVYAGHGACYFDFHGQDAQWLLDHIPPERLDDVVYINPLNPSGVIGFNPLDDVPEGEDERATDHIVTSLKHIFADSWGGRMDDILTNTVRPLFHLPRENKATLISAVRFLNDPPYRTWVLKYCRERAVRDFWVLEYGQWSKAEKNGNINSTLNKLRRFQAAPIMRRTFGQPKSSLNLARAVQDGRLLIFDFNKPKMGEVNASIMGALILSRLIREVMTRPAPTIDGERFFAALKPFMFHIDEFQSILSSATTLAFSEGRKFRMGITCVHQFTRQLTSTTPGRQVFDAIMGNVGTKVLFRVGGQDAKELHTAMELSDPERLTEISDYNFIAHLKQGNTMVQKRGLTIPLAFPHYGYGGSIMRRINADWCKPMTDIDAEYEAWAERVHYAAQPERPATKAGPQPAVRPAKKKRDGTVKKKEGFRPVGALMMDRYEVG